jgi:hypothetical protein
MRSGLDRRLTKIEARCFGGRRVAAILRIIKQADDEQLYWMLKDGQLEAMENLLSDGELEHLIGELERMNEESVNTKTGNKRDQRGHRRVTQ